MKAIYSAPPHEPEDEIQRSDKRLSDLFGDFNAIFSPDLVSEFFGDKDNFCKDLKQNAKRREGLNKLMEDLNK